MCKCTLPDNIGTVTKQETAIHDFLRTKETIISDDDWDKEIGIISNLTADEFLDFVRADFTVSKMVKLATHHPMLAVRQFFNIVKGA